MSGMSSVAGSCSGKLDLCSFYQQRTKHIAGLVGNYGYFNWRTIG
jgi:hypothetical protein